MGKSKLPFLSVAVALLASSCSVPPAEVWRDFKIKVARVFQPKTSVDFKNPSESRAQIAASRYRSLERKGKILTDASVPTGIIVEGRPGYVRSPFTDPGRLVDVREFGKGAEVRCPYTKKIFIVPNPADAEIRVAPSNLAKNLVYPTRSSLTRKTSPNGQTKPKPRTTLASQNVKPRSITPPDTKPRTVVPEIPFPGDNTKAKPGDSSTTGTSASPKLSSVLPKSTSSDSSNPDSPEDSGETSGNVPYGTPVAGRPGFARSPFAAKHQLVDVTGLPAGTEVKCPYSGKLFRVPRSSPAPDKPASPAKPSTGGSDDSSTESGDSSEADEVSSSRRSANTGSKPTAGSDQIATLDAAKLSSRSTASSTAGNGLESTESETSAVPRATAAPGKDGFVISPHASGKLVDVRGKTSGDRMRCPFTGKMFLVP